MPGPIMLSLRLGRHTPLHGLEQAYASIPLAVFKRCRWFWRGRRLFPGLERQDIPINYEGKIPVYGALSPWQMFATDCRTTAYLLVTGRQFDVFQHEFLHQRACWRCVQFLR